MKIEIREVDQARGIVRITAPDERFYARRVNTESGHPIWDYVPSVTWIANCYPKGPELLRWYAKHGWDEAEDIKRQAGEKGTRVHAAIATLVKGGTVLMDDAFAGSEDTTPVPLTPKEYHCLMTFREWCEEQRPQFVAADYTVWNERYRYAGTLDLLCRLNSTEYKVLHLIDIKTSPKVWPSMRLQVSAYKHADHTLPKGTRLGILQVGYELNKRQKYKYTAVADCFDLFLAARKMWIEENADTKPFQREYPLSLSLSGVIPQESLCQEA